jgi:hypothetical protein
VNEQRVPLRQRRDLSQIVESAFRLYGQHFGVLLGIASLVVPLGIASGIFQTIADEVVGGIVVGVITLCQAAVNLLAGAALIAALDDIDGGKPPGFGRAYDIAFARFWTLVQAILRVAFHVLLFAITIVGLPWAIQRAVRWVFVQQAIVLEGAGAKDSLDRSAEVVIGSWWRTAGCWLLLSLLAAVPLGLASLAFVAAPIVLASSANAALDALVLPFIVTATTMLYFELKLAKGGLPEGGSLNPA